MALKAGGEFVADPDLLAECMSAEQFAEWAHYAEMEPFGWQADQYCMATIASTVANSVPRGKHSKPLSINDFLLKPRFKQSVESMKKRIQAFVNG